MAAEARELHVRLIRFYARLKEQDKKWRNLLKQAENPLESLEEQAEQYRHIRRQVYTFTSHFVVIDDRSE